MNDRVEPDDYGSRVHERSYDSCHHRADLIVVGVPGRGPLSRFFLGSVSTRLVDHADNSILIAR